MRYYDIRINDHETGAVASLRAHIGSVRNCPGLSLPSIVQNYSPSAAVMTGHAALIPGFLHLKKS